MIFWKSFNKFIGYNKASYGSWDSYVKRNIYVFPKFPSWNNSGIGITSTVLQAGEWNISMRLTYVQDWL